MPSDEVKTYQAQINSGDQTDNVRASILLLDAKRFTIGTLVFVESGAAIPANITSGAPIAYYPMAVYSQVLDLLRNESPVFIEKSKQGGVWIGTLPETVGDGDKGPSKLFPLI